MRTTFSGIEIARRALQTQHRSLDVVGQNIANANTPGYSRQVAVHTASQPYPMPQFTHNPSNGMMGTGVQIEQISRMRDEFVENRLRQENHNLGYWQQLNEGIEQIELIFNEPSENGIHQSLELFYDSLQQLSRDPDNEATRAVVLQRAIVLTETISHTRSQLGALRDNMNNVVGVRVKEINSLATRIGELNDQIVKVNAAGYQPNDLLDKRDQLLQELSEITNIESVADHHGAVTVSISGATLVQHNQIFELEIRSERTDYVPVYDRAEVVWQGSGSAALISGGELGGIIHFRDNEVQNFIDKLNDWTANLINDVNSIHEEGFDLNNETGNAFFSIVGTDLTDHVSANDDPSLLIRVNIQNPAEIAASSLILDDSVVEGNGEIALRLATLRNKTAAEILGNDEGDLTGASSTLSDRFSSIIAELGVVGLEATSMVNNGETLVTHLENLRESVSGVSIDEEMADMIRFQHAYAAAARLMTTMDETLDTIISRMGLVGR